MKRSAQQNRKQHRVKREGRFTLKNLLQFLVMVPVLVLLVGNVSTKTYAASGINKQINFQGKLVDNNGLNVADSTYTVVFSLYTVSSGGSAAWTESDSVTTSNGVFQVALGAVTAFPGNVDFNSDTWYLGIKVGSDLEMTPRVRFSAVPYAFNAAALDGIVATNSASQFTITGGTNALLDLTVNGSLTLGSIIKPTAAGALTVQSNGANGLTLDTGSASTITLGATATTLHIGSSSTATAIDIGNGTGGNTITIGNGTVATGNSQSITIGTSSTGTGLNAISIGSTNGNSSVAINVSNNNGLNVDAPTGAFIQIQSTGGSSAYRLITNLNLGTVQNDFAISDSNGNSKIYLAGSSNNAGFVKDAVGVGPGFVTPRAALDVEGGNTSGNAALILNQLGASANDILSASASGATKFTISNGGTVTIAAGQSYTGSGAVTLSSGGSSGLTIDSASGRVSIATGDFLNSGVAGVSGAISGDIWYDTTAQKFKINENGTTKILCNLTDTGCGTGGAVTLQGAYNGGQTIDLSTTGTGLTIGTNAGTQNIVFAPNAGGQAGLIINDQGNGDIFTASASGSTKLVLSHAGNLGIGTNAPQEELTLGATANLVGEMAIPTGAAAALQSGGSLANATYFYVVTASDGLGETLKSTETSGCTSTNAGGGQHTCLVTWNSVVGAAAYKIYRTTTSGTYGATTFLTSVATTSYTDTGAVSLTSGTPPSATTAYVTKFTYSGNSWLIGDNFGLGTTSPLASLHVKGGKSGGNAAAIFDQVGASTNDILTGSASGTTKFIVHNDGSIQTVGNNATADVTTITGGNSLTILPKANASGAGGALTLKGGNGTGAAGGGVVIDAGTGSTNGTISIGTTNQSGLTLGRSGATTTINGSSITLGAAAGVSGALTVTSNGSTALAVGANGSTNPVLQVDSSTGSVATGLKILGAATGGTTALSVIDSGTNASLSIDAKGNGTITLGGTSTGNITLGRATGVSGALTITSNSSAALTVGANGSTNPIFTVNASTGSVATGLQVLGAATGGTTALSVTDSGSAANLSIDAKGTGTITVGGTSTGNITIGNTSTTTITLGGSGSNPGLTFNLNGGPSYTGTARPTKQIILSAEYPGAVLTASGSAAILGNMTSDASPSAVTTTTNNYENYYMWAATALGSDQQYTVAVRVALPKDFSDWASGNAITVDFNTPFTNNALNALDVFIYKGGDTSGKPVAFSKTNASGTSKNWTQVSFTKAQLTSVAPTLTAAGQEAVFYLTLHSTNTVNYVQVGDITLNYLAAF